MLPHQIYKRHLRPARIVQIRKAIAQARTEMKQSACRFLRHAGVAVGRSGDDALEEAENATHFADPVERGDDVYF
jgi:hypothetical protein